MSKNDYQKTQTLRKIRIFKLSDGCKSGGKWEFLKSQKHFFE